MSRELLSNLGYRIVKEEHEIIDGKKVSMCINFNSDKFLKPKYSPPGLTFVECDSDEIKSMTILDSLAENIETANKIKNYTERMGGEITGGIILNNTLRDQLRKEILESAVSKNFFWWDIHRIFFYAMKVFSHSILENWVSQSKLGFVLTEHEIKEQFELAHYYTTVLTGIRYSDLSSRLEVYFSYFVDCLKSPLELQSGIDVLHADNVKNILDDVYERMSDITNKFYPGTKKSITIEIHSLAGFTYDAEFKVKLYSQHYKNWQEVDVDKLTVDEHTLFKYSIIPWEAIMDYAFTKKTGVHTHKDTEIENKLYNIEKNFANEFRQGVRDGVIKEPFTKQFFTQKENITVCNYTSLYNADIIDIPIKQRLIMFSRTDFKEPKNEAIEKIVDTLESEKKYNYTWIGILSSTGFSLKAIEFVNNFKRDGIGLAFVDVVTKRLLVNGKTEEGKHINAMFLSECIS